MPPRAGVMPRRSSILSLCRSPRHFIAVLLDSATASAGIECEFYARFGPSPPGGREEVKEWRNVSATAAFGAPAHKSRRDRGGAPRPLRHLGGRRRLHSLCTSGGG